MSFILEALKKSDKKREDTVVPNLHTVHITARPVVKKKPLWPYLLVVGLLLNAGILFWFLTPSVEPPLVPAVLTTADVPKGTPDAVVSPAAEPLAQVAASEPVPAPPVVVVDESPVVVDHAQAPPVEITPEVVEMTAFSAAEAESEPFPIEDVPILPRPELRWEDERPIYAVADLPYDVQGRLPELHLSVYAYSSDAASRLVRVNNRILREGNYLEVGLRLDEITPNGLVLSFEGYRFRVAKE